MWDTAAECQRAITLGQVRFVLFDAVGTLLRPAEPVAKTYRRLAAALGSQQSAEQIAARFAAALGDEERAADLRTDEEIERRRWQGIVRRCVPDLTDAAVAELFSQLWQHYASGPAWRLYDDVPPALRRLADSGWQLGIASNWDARLHSVRRHHGPLNDIPMCVVSSEIGWRKPAPEFFQAVARRLDCPPHEILLVGDSRPLDFAAARAAGWQSLLLDRSATADETSSDPDRIRNLHQLICLD